MLIDFFGSKSYSMLFKKAVKTSNESPAQHTCSSAQSLLELVDCCSELSMYEPKQQPSSVK